MFKEPIDEAVRRGVFIPVKNIGWRVYFNDEWVRRSGGNDTFKTLEAAQYATEFALSGVFYPMWREVPENNAFYLQCVKNSYPEGPEGSFGSILDPYASPSVDDYYLREGEAFRAWMDSLYDAGIVTYRKIVDNRSNS